MVEVRANLSFSGAMGSFTRYGVYLVDETDRQTKALLEGGYLSLTFKEEGNDRLDSAGSSPVSGHGVAVGMARRTSRRPAKTATKEVTDVQGGVESSRGDSDSAASGVADGAQNH